MNHKQAITLIMGYLIKGYGRRFEFDTDGSTAMFWEAHLGGFEPDVLVAATSQFIRTSSSQWPPTPGQVCAIALDLSYGELLPQSAEEAWYDVLRYVQTGCDTTLPPLTLQALRMIGGSSEVKQSPNVSMVASRYTKVYNKLAERRRVNRLTLDNVRQLADGRARKLLKAVK